MKIKYDRWVGASPYLTDEEGFGKATMLIKHLAHFRGYRIDLHCFRYPDPFDAFHSHPAKAIRIVLAGGYIEEIVTEPMNPESPRKLHSCWPGHISVVRPAFCHRIASLIDGPSYSLWLRAPITHKVHLIGKGWPETAKPYDTMIASRKRDDLLDPYVDRVPSDRDILAP